MSPTRVREQVLVNGERKSNDASKRRGQRDCSETRGTAVCVKGWGTKGKV